MRLKKLELFGFKSFADRTEVLFDEGVTCVVGPNGCGKSNISDAIRWVLGERSAKLLRGSKMEDVIFSGTDYRKPLALAEVSLTVDNTDRGLPIDYQEVTLTRRLYRSGESEYMINRTICRLKDIQDLILDTGIGSSAYSMIEQGRIDYILNADAEERRFLIEEAAGISKYKVKKEEAIRKLERTEENLVRLNDIVQEVHKNIQYAERQAKRAEKYKRQFEELKTLEIQKTFFDLGHLAAEKSKIEAENRSAATRQSELDRRRSEYEKQLESVEKELLEIADKMSGEEQKRYGLKLQLEQNEQQIRFNHEKRIEFATRRGENQSEEGQITERLEKGSLEIEARQKDLNGFEGEKDEVFEKLKSSESRLQQIEQELESAKNERENGKLELFQVSSESVKIKNEVHRLSAWLETSEERKRRLHANLGRFRHEKEQWQSKGEAYNQELGNLEQRLSGLADRQKEKNTVREELKTRISQHEDETQRTERELHEMEIRLQMLKEIDASQRKEQAEILSEHPGLERSLVRSLRDILRVQKGYELALEAALGSLAKSWVAKNFETAEKIMSVLKGGKSAPVTFFIHEAAASGEGLV
ncbi:MAG TPA: AAA family ATPase, partial [bacterium]|nr:AAA family ATPase [bacterium]